MPGINRLALAGSAVAIFAATAANADIIIDDWSMDQGPFVNSFGDTTEFGTVLGGQRRIFFQNTTGSGDYSAEVTDARLRTDIDPEARTFTSVIWDGGQNQVGLGGIDITEGGTNDRFRIAGLGTDGAVGISFFVSQEIGRRSLLTRQLSATNGAIDLLFSDFNSASPGEIAADFTNVGAIYIDFSLRGSAGVSYFRAGTISIVPAPATIAAISLAGLASTRRRRGH